MYIFIFIANIYNNDGERYNGIYEKNDREKKMEMYVKHQHNKTGIQIVNRDDRYCQVSENH